MMYEQIKNQIEKIIEKVGVKNNKSILLAYTYMMYVGAATLSCPEKVELLRKNIQDKFKLGGRIFLLSEADELMMLSLAVELSKLSPFSVLAYFQRECWVYSGGIGNISHEKAIDVLRRVVEYEMDTEEPDDAIDFFQDIGLSPRNLYDLSE